MKTEQTITSRVQDARWGLVVEENDEDANTFEYVTEMSEEQLAKVAKRFKVSPELMFEIAAHFDNLRDEIHADLADIWKQVTKN